jgi:hypothetical protein
LLIAFLMLRDGTPYRDLGDDFFDRLHPERTANRLLQRLANLGIHLQPVSAPGPSLPQTL